MFHRTNFTLSTQEKIKGLKNKEDSVQPATPCLNNCGVSRPYSNRFLNIVLNRGELRSRSGLTFHFVPFLNPPMPATL